MRSLPRAPSTLPLRWHFVLLLVGALVPVVAFAVLVVVRLAYEQRADASRRLTHSARLMGAALEREISGSVRALTALAESDRLRAGDLKGFSREAGRVRATQPAWMTVILAAPDGRQLVNTGYLAGERLPKVADPGSLKRILRTGQPTVGFLNRGPRGNWAFPVRVPVRHGSRIPYVLTSVITPEALGRVVSGESLDAPEWIRTVVDSRGVVVARTRSPGQSIGEAASPSFLRRIAAVPDGVYRDTLPDGSRAYVAFSRAAPSGWTAAVTVPAGAVDGPVRNSALIAAGLGLLVLAASGAGACAISRGVSRGIAAATGAADAVAQGKPLVMPDVSVSELYWLRKALERAALLLEERERERDEHLLRAEVAREEAEAANRAKDEFLALLGHELRNPLAPILNTLYVVRTRGETRPRDLDILSRQAQHLSVLVDDLLDVSRVCRGNVQLACEETELWPVVERALEMTAPLVEQYEHRLTVDVRSEGLPLLADPVRLTQVVSNLLANAAKYTPPGGRIEVQAAREGEWICLSVADNGQGLSEELLPHLFEMFVQGPRALDRREGGLGLGLAIARSLTALHDGELTAESDGPGRGSTFTLRLPARAPVGAVRADTAAGVG